MTPSFAPAGIGVRVGHYAQILECGVAAECAEVVTENFLDRGGRPEKVLERLRRDMPLILHGVGLSLGSVEPLNTSYLESLLGLCGRCEPFLVSDHLCFSSVARKRTYDLWPLPYTEEAVHHVSERIRHVQDTLGRRIAIENVSSYVTYRSSEMSEEQFLRAVLSESDCLCLLDINNVYVSAANHGFDPISYIESVPREKVAYYHLAGHTDLGTHLLDDHGSEVGQSVWELFDLALRRIGPRPTIVEWDTRLPSLSTIEAQAAQARQHIQAAHPGSARGVQL